MLWISDSPSLFSRSSLIEEELAREFLDIVVGRNYFYLDLHSCDQGDHLILGKEDSGETVKAPAGYPPPSLPVPPEPPLEPLPFLTKVIVICFIRGASKMCIFISSNHGEIICIRTCPV